MLDCGRCSVIRTDPLGTDPIIIYNKAACAVK